MKKHKKTSFYSICLIILAAFILIYRNYCYISDFKENISEESSVSLEDEDMPVIQCSSETDNNIKKEKFPASFGREIIKYKAKNDGKKVVFLTFDDGPSKNNTPKILDTLDKNGIKGTFFLIGKNVDRGGEYAEIVKRMHQEGHTIGSHGYTHSSKNLYPNGTLSIENLIKEIDDTDKAISNALGTEYKCKVFRFPYGEGTRIYKHDKNIKNAIDVLAEHGIVSIDWNSLTEDAVGAKKSKSQLMSNLKKTSKGKDKIVVLLHDSEDRKDTAEMIQDIIDYFSSQGYIFGAFDI